MTLLSLPQLIRPTAEFFFADLKPASMNDSLRSSFPQARSLLPVSGAVVRAMWSAASVGSGDDGSDRVESDAADRVVGSRCANPKIHLSAPLANPATVGLAHLSAASGEKAVREAPIDRR